MLSWIFKGNVLFLGFFFDLLNFWYFVRVELTWNICYEKFYWSSVIGTWFCSKIC